MTAITLPRQMGHAAISKDLNRDHSICHYGAELLGGYNFHLPEGLTESSLQPSIHGRPALLEDNHSLLRPFTIPTLPSVLVDTVSRPIILMMALDFSRLNANASVLEEFSSLENESYWCSHWMSSHSSRGAHSASPIDRKSVDSLT